MKGLSWLDRLLYWIENLRYNCKKNRHRWGYCLSDTGIVYRNDKDVPKDAWLCLDCKVKRF